MIERIHLQIIEALARCGSLSKAADELHLTQPALTHSIRKLESLSGSRLWERRGRRLQLTQAGSMLLSLAEIVLPRFRSAESDLKAYGQGRRGRLRLGVECHPCYEWLVGSIEHFLVTWPDVELDVTRSFQFDGLSALQEYEIDLMVSPDYIPRQGLKYIAIHDFELQLVSAVSHPLAAVAEARGWVEAEDLATAVLFAYPITIERLDVYTQFLQPAGVLPGEHSSVEAIEIMLQLVAAGRGVSTMPDWLIRRHSSELPVSGYRLGEQGIHKKLYLVYREEDRNIPYIDDFIRCSHQSA